MTNINIHIQETQETSSGINSRRFIPRYIIVKLQKANHKEHLEGSKKKCVITYKKVTSKRSTADSPLKITEARKQWDNILKMLKEKCSQPRTLYPINLSFKNKEKMKIFPNNQN